MRIGFCASIVGACALFSALPAAGASQDALAPDTWRVTTLPIAPSFAEPGVAIGAEGTILVDAASANTGAPPTVWMSHDAGSSWTPGHTFGNPATSTGDADVAVGSDGRLYALNLGYSASPPGQPANPTILAYSSTDGRTWAGPASFSPPHGIDQPDRPWLVVNPAHPADVLVVNSEVGGNVVAWRSTDHAATFSGPIPVTGGPNGEAALALSSRPLVDPTDDRRIFMLYETLSAQGLATTVRAGNPLYEFPFTQIWIAASLDGGQSWSNAEVLDTAALAGRMRNATVAHLLVATAIDARGRLYAAFAARPAGATTTEIELLSSADHGRSWTAPITVPSPSRSNVMPALAVSGDGGIAYVSWYSSSSADFRDAHAAWTEMAAVIHNPSSYPAVTTELVGSAAPVHVGGIDTAGAIGSDLGANWGLRDFQSIALDACDRPHLVWAIDAGRHATQTAAPSTACESAVRPAGAASTTSMIAAALPGTASPGTPGGIALMALGAIAARAARRRRG